MMDANDIRARIEAARNPKPVAVTIDGLGEVLVRKNTHAQANEVRAITKELEALDADGKRGARMAAMCLCDEEGALLYDARNPEHVDLLAGLTDNILSDILSKSRDINYPPIEKDASGKA